MEHRRHIRLVVVPAQAVMLPGHAAAATEKQERSIECFFSLSEWLSLRRRIHRKVIDDDNDPKRRRETLPLPLPQAAIVIPVVAFPLPREIDPRRAGQYL